MSEISNYKCPACTGPLRFDGATGRLVCDYCDSTYDVSEIEALYAEADKESEEEFEKKEEAGAKEKEEAGTFAQEAEDETAPEMTGRSDINADDSTWGSEAGNIKVYSCPSCGAELICDETTAATSCPYCGNNTIIPGQLGGSTLKPDLIIPFKLDKKQAVEALKNHYKGKFFLPGPFRDKNHIEEIKGIYVPFWLFDGEAEASVDFNATRTHLVPGHKADVLITEHYNVHRGGTLDFSKIPTDASSKMPDAMMDSIEPFDYSELKPFSTAYLPGFFADKYDVTADESTERADNRARSTTLDCFQGTVNGYQTCSVSGSNIDIHRGKVHYALLPVWMLTTKWKDETYMFAMNGQTGKFIGDLPVDKGRVGLTFAGISIPLMIILGLLMFLVV